MTDALPRHDMSMRRLKRNGIILNIYVVLALSLLHESSATSYSFAYSLDLLPIQAGQQQHRHNYLMSSLGCPAPVHRYLALAVSP